MTDDDIRPGVPGYGRPTPVPEPPADEPGPRPGDPGTGRPVMAAASVSDLSEADRRRIADADAAARADDDPHADSLPLPDVLRRPSLIALLAAVGSLTGIVAFAQTLSAAQAIAALESNWLRYAAFCLLGALVVMLLLSAGWLTVAFARLSRTRRVPLPGLAVLATRAVTRRLALDRPADARVRLAVALRDFVPTGLPADAARHVAVARDFLLDAGRYGHAGEWLARYRADILGPLEVAADARIAHHARRVAMLTAASPNALTDTLLVGHAALEMVAELCGLFGLTVGRAAAAILLGRLLASIYLTAPGDEPEGAAERLQGLLGEWTATKFVTRLGPKATAAALNFLLIRRLGTSAVQVLRPINPA